MTTNETAPGAQVRDTAPPRPARLFIHYSPSGFSSLWIEYCDRRAIPYRRVDVYSREFWQEVKPTDILMWHYAPNDEKADRMLLSLELANVLVFPNLQTRFGFDDKMTQGLFREVSGVPYSDTTVLLKRDEAKRYVEDCDLPVVFKLATGNSSNNVKLVRDRKSANTLIRRMFGRGIATYDRAGILKRRLTQFRRRQVGVSKVLSAAARLFLVPRHMKKRDHDYILFQEFLPDNDSDMRIVVIDEKAFGMTRYNAPGDFRASASGLIDHDPDKIDPEAVRLCFKAAKMLNTDCCAFDVLKTGSGEFEIIEFCFGFFTDTLKPCPGYWNSELQWTPGPFDPYGWVVETMLQRQRETEEKIGGR